MRNYSYCFRKKGTKEYISSGVMHELEFLDYMSLQFSGKEELMKFLGVDFNKYDDIEVKDVKTGEILPIVFDPLELMWVLEELVSTPFNSSSFETKYAPSGYSSYESLDEDERTIIGYNYPEIVTTKDISNISTIRPLSTIYAALLSCGFALKAYKEKLISEEAYNKIKNGDITGFISETSKDYLSIRNICVAATKIPNYYLLVSSAPEMGFPYKKMTDITSGFNGLFDENVYNMLKSKKLLPCEEEGVISFFFFDNNLYSDDPNHEPVDAYAMLKRCSSEKLDDILKYVETKKSLQIKI